MSARLQGARARQGARPGVVHSLQLLKCSHFSLCRPCVACHAKSIQSHFEGYGPRGFILSGMSKTDVESLSKWVEDMEPGLPLCCVHDGMLDRALQDAVYEEDKVVRPTGWMENEVKLPRICMMSGLKGDEELAIVESWAKYAGSEPPIFAAVVPNIANMPVQEALAGVESAYKAGMTESGKAGPQLRPVRSKDKFDPEMIKKLVHKKKADKDQKEAARTEKKAAKQPPDRAKGFG